jgi:hypothetical protein
VQRRGSIQQQIVAFLRSRKEPTRATDLSAICSPFAASIRLHKLVKMGYAQKLARGLYEAAIIQPYRPHGTPRKLTPKKVQDLREAVARGQSVASQARNLGINRGTASMVVAGHRWARVGGPRVDALALREAKLEVRRREIRRALADAGTAKRAQRLLASRGHTVKYATIWNYWKRRPKVSTGAVASFSLH